MTYQQLIPQNVDNPSRCTSRAAGEPRSALVSLPRYDCAEMAASPFRVLREPGVARVLATELLARFPAGMISLSVLMHTEQTYGAYGPAGLCVAAIGVGQAVCGPISSRLLSRFGMRPVLLATTIAASLSLFGIALVPGPLWVTILLALIMGITTPPITPAARTVFPTIVDGKKLTAVFAVDATLQELIWVLGPLVATGIALFLSPQVGVIAAGLVLLVGAFAFTFSPEVSGVRPRKPKRRLGAVLRNPVVLVMTMLNLFMVGLFGGTETAVVAMYGHDRPEAGIAIGLSAVGSIIGGLLFGARPVSSRSLLLRAIPMVVGALMCCVWDNTIWVYAGFIITGLGCAPLLSGIYACVSSSVKFSQTPEAFAWMGSGQVIGSAIATAIAGPAIDVFGPVGGFATGAIFGTLGIVLLIIAGGTVPDLSHGDASPHPDTQPIETIRKAEPGAA